MVAESSILEVTRALDAAWRDQSARIVAGLARSVGDVGLAEDLAQDALAEALASWPRSGIPVNPAAWLTTVAQRRAIDGHRRRVRLDERHEAAAHELSRDAARAVVDAAPPWDPDSIDDDVLRLVFIACHPVLAREAQTALTLRIVAGLTTEEIARAFLVPVATVQQRIVRAKKTLAAARVPFELPPRDERHERLAAVLEVVYLVFTEGYSATSGDAWVREDLAREAIRLGTLLASLQPREPDVHALLALMELQASRFAARVGPSGEAVLLADQDRGRWDHDGIRRGIASLARSDALTAAAGRGRTPYGLQAALAACHATAATAADTDWDRIVVLYEALGRLAPSPIVDLNRAVAVSQATGPATALIVVDALVEAGTLAGYAPLAAVRGDLLERLHRPGDARVEFLEAARLTRNERERAVLLDRAARTGTTAEREDHP